MKEYIDNASERAGMIISFLTKIRFVFPLKAKEAVLKALPYKSLVSRLLSLAFNRQILRLNLADLCKNKSVHLVDADFRLAEFIRIHECFYSGELSLPESLERITELMQTLHTREYSFYEDLLEGGTCYLDYMLFKRVFKPRDKSDANLVRFMRPKEASPDTIWTGKKIVVQPNMQGLQLKVILDRGKKPKLVSGAQDNYASRMMKSLRLAKEWMEDYGLTHAEFDAVLVNRETRRFPAPGWKAESCVLYVYDYAKKDMPLNKRIKVAQDFCSFMKRNKNKRIVMMTTEVLTGPLVSKMAQSYSRATNPDAIRNGVVVKKWDSPYVLRRSGDWQTFFPYKASALHAMLGRATIIGVSSNFQKVHALTNNGIEVCVSGNPALLKPLKNYIGYTIEFNLDTMTYHRVLFDKGREI